MDLKQIAEIFNYISFSLVKFILRIISLKLNFSNFSKKKLNFSNTFNNICT